jgi:hypothetical protein
VALCGREEQRAAALALAGRHPVAVEWREQAA